MVRTTLRTLPAPVRAPALPKVHPQGAAGHRVATRSGQPGARTGENPYLDFTDVLSERQELLLRKVVDWYSRTGQPVGSKALAADPEIEYGPSTIRNELAVLEEQGLLAHPHTSAGRVPTDAGYRYFVDRLLPERRTTVDLSLMRREVDDAMRVATETLSQLTNLMAIVSAPPIQTTTIRHVEVLLLQPQVLMVVVITSTGGVSKRVFTFERPVDPGLADWAGAYLNEQLVGRALGARSLRSRLADPGLPATERAFVEALAPAFFALEETAESTLYVDGAHRLFAEMRVDDVRQLHELMEVIERRAALLGALQQALTSREVYVRIGRENELPALRSMSMVAANYGLPSRNLGTVSVVGPTRMDYAATIGTVRAAAGELSRFVEDVWTD
jgi:heat-inducible transcriptional repressor